MYFCFTQRLSKWTLEPQFTTDIGLVVFHFSVELLSPFLMTGMVFPLFLCCDTTHILLTPSIKILQFLELVPSTLWAGGGQIFCTSPLPRRVFCVCTTFSGLQDACSKSQLLLMANTQLAAHPGEGCVGDWMPGWGCVSRWAQCTDPALD